MKVIEHYENHLAAYYDWIYGGAENKINENMSFFEKYGISPHSSGIAIDLGAGPGFQTIPLATTGFRVFSIDFSEKLLNELKDNKNGLDITIINSNIMDFSAYKNIDPELIVCMGDTLTHLESIPDVKSLINNCRLQLAEGGSLVLTFRDLTHELTGICRFIPVMSDENRIFTCFLEDHQEYVNVYDIVNERTGGKWLQKISYYKKIKIPPDEIRKILIESNFSIKLFEIGGGLITVIAEAA
jgi:SAM-dependent methyltransferase